MKRFLIFLFLALAHIAGAQQRTNAVTLTYVWQPAGSWSNYVFTIYATNAIAPLPWPVLTTTTGTNKFSLAVSANPTDTWYFVVSVHDQRNSPTNFIPDSFSGAVQTSLNPDGQLTIGKGF